MFRAVILFLLVLGIVIGGLMLLKRTAGKPPPEGYKRLGSRDSRDDDADGW